MTATLKDVRTAIATTLSAVLTDVKMYRRVPESIVAPCIVIQPAAADYLVVHGNGATGWEFDLQVLVRSTDDDVAQEELDDYVTATGTKSIVRIIHATPALGRTDASAVVRSLTAYGSSYTVSGDTFVGATLRLYVILTN